MEEDDDNFLDGVIEFGDGRQYKVEPADALRQSSPPRPPPRIPRDDGESSGDIPTETSAMSATPVSKEERFADDFDRSWPRSKTSPAVPSRDFSHSRHQPVPPSPVSSQPHASPQEASRVLFNPYSGAHPPNHRSGQPSHTTRRADFSTSPTDSRRPRDATSVSQGTNIHLLQKPGFGNDVPPRSRGNFGPSSFDNDRHRDRDFSRRDPPPGADFRRSKEQFDPFGVPASPAFKDRDVPDNRGRRLSNMGPPPLPAASIRDRSKDQGRQLPPHMPPINGPSLHRPPSRETHAQSPTLLTSSPSSASRALSRSPVLSRGAVAALSPSDVPSLTPGVPSVDIEEVRKDVMQSAAARAKQRRQQQEEEREKEKERARRKADELAAKTKPKEVDPPKPAEIEVSLSCTEFRFLHYLIYWCPGH
jgi:serine/arginine repetitive matrix protein 2